MTSYLEARQRVSLRRDIAACRIPHEGPFSPGERSFYWQAAKSKTRQGAPSGLWFRANVLPLEGAICGIDTGSSVMPVKQSTLGRETDDLNDYVFH